MSDDLQKAIEVCSEMKNHKALMNAYLSIGRFADLNYKRVYNYMNTPVFKSKKDSIVQCRETVTIFRSRGHLNKEQLRAIIIMEKQITLDEQEVTTMKNDLQCFLHQAIENYSNCLKMGEKHDLRIFHLISLWFQNQTTEVSHLMKKHAKEIKTSKFLPLLHQLAARMKNKRNDFEETLNGVIEQIVIDHPYHSLMIILALQNANMDEMYQQPPPPKSTKAKSSILQTKPEEERVTAAKNMITRLCYHQNLKTLIKTLEFLCEAYISLANYSNFSDSTSSVSIPGDNKLLKISKFCDVPVITMDLPINSDGIYDKIIGIESYEATFQLCGGINAPKILICTGTDGQKRRQLLKGKDDMRQDAVMQQVFRIVNAMLQKNVETKIRNLSIRTYKVIPFSQRSGILEWCEGTEPFGKFLIGKAGAHCRYYPNDITAEECRKKMMQKMKGSAKEKYDVFQEICSHFRPVFRHFFLENYPQPDVWFERRLMYTRSVAAYSIVGYILGLGDRHVQNILLDISSAEFIHIDLGIAFDQGKVLPIPETVPFRLTRDVVNGMGITGVEGVFRRCCEKTFEVLQQAHEIVLTILEVLLYDPLYMWAISPSKAYNLQHGKDVVQLSKAHFSSGKMETNALASCVVPFIHKDDSINSQAERVLLQLQQKLQGIVDGRPMTVDSLVNYLIQEATDPKNLCRIFHGWQPFL